jgi:hypothetical protein
VKLLAAEFDGDILYVTKFQTEGKVPTESRIPIRDF